MKENLRTLSVTELGKFGTLPEYNGPFRINLSSLLRDYGKLDFCIKEVLSSWILHFEDEAKNIIKLHVLEENVIKSRQVHCDNCRVIGWTNHPLSRKRYHFIIPSSENENLYTLLDKKIKAPCTNCKLSNFPLQNICDKCKHDSTAEKDKTVIVSDCQNHLLHGLLHVNGFGHLLRINGRDRASKILTGSQIMDLWDRLCSLLRARQVSVMDVSKKRSLDLRLVHGIAYGKSWYGKWNYSFGKGSYGVISQDYAFALHTVRSAMLFDVARHFDGFDDEIVRILLRYQKLHKMTNSSLPSLQTLSDLFCLFLQIIQICNHHTDISPDPDIIPASEPNLSFKAIPNLIRHGKNEATVLDGRNEVRVLDGKISPRKSQIKSPKATDGKNVKKNGSDGKNVKPADGKVATCVSVNKPINHSEVWSKPDNVSHVCPSPEPQRGRETSAHAKFAEKHAMKSVKKKNTKSEKKMTWSADKIDDAIHAIHDVLYGQPRGHWIPRSMLCNSVCGKVMDNDVLDYMLDASKEEVVRMMGIGMGMKERMSMIQRRYNSEFNWMEYRIERSVEAPEKNKKSKLTIQSPNRSTHPSEPMSALPKPDHLGSGFQKDSFFSTMRESVQRDMSYIYRNVFLGECKLAGSSSLSIVSSLPHASRIILDSKHLLKDYVSHFERMLLVRSELRSQVQNKKSNMQDEEKTKKIVVFQNNKDVFRITCKLKFKIKEGKGKGKEGGEGEGGEERDENLFKIDCPPEPVLLPRSSTVGDLKKAIAKTFRELYFIMNDVEVESIPYLSDTSDSTSLKSLAKKMSIPCTVYATVLGLDKDSKYRFEGGNDDWMVSCLCGTCDDDGEFMVACDRCDTWQHARCVGLLETDSSPPSFLCQNCIIRKDESCPDS